MSCSTFIFKIIREYLVVTTKDLIAYNYAHVIETITERPVKKLSFHLLMSYSLVEYSFLCGNGPEIKKDIINLTRYHK